MFRLFFVKLAIFSMLAGLSSVCFWVFLAIGTLKNRCVSLKKNSVFINR